MDGAPETMRRNRWIEQQVLEKCTTNVHLGLKIYWLLRAALGHLEVPTRRGLPQITGVRRGSPCRVPCRCGGWWGDGVGHVRPPDGPTG